VYHPQIIFITFVPLLTPNPGDATVYYCYYYYYVKKKSRQMRDAQWQ